MGWFLPYMAGFFDGEGYVWIQKHQRADYTTHHLWVVVSNTVPAPLQLMKERWSGHLVLIKRHNLIQRDIWRMHLSTNQAALFLTETMPYLIIKKPQAEVALAFHEHVQESKRLYRHVKGKKGIQPLPPEVYPVRDDFMRQLHELNKRGRVLETEQEDEESSLLATGLSTA